MTTKAGMLFGQLQEEDVQVEYSFDYFGDKNQVARNFISPTLEVT